MPVTHAFASGKADGGDTTLVRPSDWNAAHAITDLTLGGATPFLQFPNYTTPAVGAASSGRLAYESATQQLRLSRNGGAYADLLSGGLTANQIPHATAAGSLAPMTGLTWTDANSKLAWAQGTLTTSQPFFSHTATWNAAGVTFHNFDTTITGTAMADGSSFRRWILDGNTRISIERDLAAHSSDIGLKFRNAANTADFMMGEWIGTSFVPRYKGAGGLIIQTQNTTASGQAFRLGLMSGGGSTYATFGGDVSGTAIIYRNVTTAIARLCLGNVGSVACEASLATILLFNETAGQATSVDVRAGATQGTTPLLRFRNNADSATLGSVDQNGDYVLRSVAFASLPASGNGTLIYCSDCTIASPCASGGSGALAKRVNGAWVCN
ncbi:MAG: hypothetical protein C4523_12680 [Myxococcales bacterium]|nr:MAG: hypothetical protein C4523_12680 [Myxococcales bacterium]